MKKRLLPGLLVLILVFPVFADKYDNAGIDYSKCLFDTETAEARVKCLEGYIQTYPDTGKKFTRLAFCMLALNHFDTKNYAKTVEIGEKSLQIGGMDDGLQAKLLLALGSACGISSSPVYDKNKAIKYTGQAIELAEKAGEKGLAQKARGIKTRLSAPPAPQLTPEQIFKKLVSQDRFTEAIVKFKKLSDAVKNNPENREIYAKVLQESRLMDAALKEFNRLYTENKKAKYARSISGIYEEKARRNRTLYKDSSIYLIEASLLYRKEGNQSNADKAFEKARYNYNEVYDLNNRIKKYREKPIIKGPSEEEIKKTVRRIEYKIRKEERRLEKLYPDMDPPAFEYKTLNKLKKDLERAKSGPGPVEDKEGAELFAQQQKVEKEFSALVTQVKSRI